MNTVVYVITGKPEGRDQRAMALMRLNPHFTKMTYVHPSRVRKQLPHGEPIRPWHNPFRLLEFMGLPALARWFTRMVFFPTADILFVYAARRRLCKSIRKDIAAGHEVRVIISPPPHAPLYLARAIKKQAPQASVIIDWQDLWSYDDVYYQLVPGIYRKRLVRTERALLPFADKHVMTNCKAKQILQDKYAIPAEKVFSINHHFDDTDVSESPDAYPLHEPEGYFNIGFLGNFFKPPKVPGVEVLTALDQAAARVPVKLHMQGDRTLDGETDALQHLPVEEYPVADIPGALARLSHCDAVLITLADLPNCRVIMHGKLSQYFQLDVPIIAMVPDDSFVADIVRATGTGIVLPDPAQWHVDVQRIAKQIRCGEINLCRNQQLINTFSWENVSRQWLDVLDATGDEALRSGQAQVTA